MDGWGLDQVYYGILNLFLTINFYTKFQRNVLIYFLIYMSEPKKEAIFSMYPEANFVISFACNNVIYAQYHLDQVNLNLQWFQLI